MKKSRRQDDPKQYCLVEEHTEYLVADGGGKGRRHANQSNTRRRVLADHERVYQVQKQWTGTGTRFIMTDRSTAFEHVSCLFFSVLRTIYC